MFGKSESIENWEQILRDTKEGKIQSKLSVKPCQITVETSHLENVKNSEWWSENSEKLVKSKCVKLNWTSEREEIE